MMAYPIIIINDKKFVQPLYPYAYLLRHFKQLVKHAIVHYYIYENRLLVSFENDQYKNFCYMYFTRKCTIVDLIYTVTFSQIPSYIDMNIVNKGPRNTGRGLLFNYSKCIARFHILQRLLYFFIFGKNIYKLKRDFQTNYRSLYYSMNWFFNMFKMYFSLVNVCLTF